MARKKVIHVNRHVIASNTAHSESQPPLSVRAGKTNVYGHEIEIKGSCRIVYNPDKPLPCGATVWIETESEVIVIERKLTAL